MSGWAHIVLVGASIISNAFRDGVISDSIPHLEEKLKNNSELWRDMLERLLSFLERDCKKASAELNTCIDLIIEGYNNGKQQWCHLLSSETNVGRLCSEVLARYLRDISRRRLDGRLAVVEPITIPCLGNPERFNDGLANLFEKVIEIISYHKNKGDMVFVHATGGYKPETAIAILAANSPGAGAPTFYIHEHFNQLIRIPALPITFRRWKKLSNIIDSLIDVDKVNREQYVKIFSRRAVREAVRLGWIIEEDNLLKLTPFGRLLWRKMKGQHAQ
jgi:putative CRISPR-associated protein (TIGR02619 family)